MVDLVGLESWDLVVLGINEADLGAQHVHNIKVGHELSNQSQAMPGTSKIRRKKN